MPKLNNKNVLAISVLTLISSIKLITRNPAVFSHSNLNIVLEVMRIVWDKKKKNNQTFQFDHLANKIS